MWCRIRRDVRDRGREVDYVYIYVKDEGNTYSSVDCSISQLTIILVLK